MSLTPMRWMRCLNPSPTIYPEPVDASRSSTVGVASQSTTANFSLSNRSKRRDDYQHSPTELTEPIRVAQTEITNNWYQEDAGIAHPHCLSTANRARAEAIGSLTAHPLKTDAFSTPRSSTETSFSPVPSIALLECIWRPRYTSCFADLFASSTSSSVTVVGDDPFPRLPSPISSATTVEANR